MTDTVADPAGQAGLKRISVLSDLSERVPYTVPGLPIYAQCDALSIFADYRCACHWHRDLEFIRVVSGEMRYFVNGSVTLLRPGEGMVVNSSRLHYGFSPEHRDARFSCAVIGPSLVEGVAPSVRTRCERAFGQDMDDFLLLSSGVDWQRDVLMGIDRLVTQLHGERPARGPASSLADPASGHWPDIDPLPAAATAIGLYGKVLDRFRPAAASTGAGGATHGGDGSSDQRDRIVVLEMTGMVQSRFAEPLGLEDIARAGAVSRSRCCALFRRYVGRTPNEYLTERRLEEAKRLLAGTDGAVAEVARACGFSSSSYFISVFRKRLGMTPNAYRGTRS
ncbi:AraC family transcriptional regulator [Bifidobacterium saguinibicoloris]|uniref:AraC family transcriptional regulator n=1 Tax=Bifidobacterium saguinibicoloris TaxID=2834433 RepID=UPI001C560839|nr:AraC family transcriptional regulator [Bifidobacterium saguinibicoloris]MBW3080045.1 AraC family transcriptional regulator [Bifidobacterium saguinibicoloris]